MPSSWLVVYNTNDFFSGVWANSYQVSRNIPPENMLGVEASTIEHLATREQAEAQIIGPVRNYLLSHPEIEQRIMGILVGYGVPGTFATPPSGGPGGYSVADALEDMWDDQLPSAEQKEFNSVDNPQFLVPPQMLPPGGRLTKATMEPGRYMVARLDAPSWTAAINITTRAIAFETNQTSIAGQHVFYDYIDLQALPQGEWVWLRMAVEEPGLAGTPWQAFDSDTEGVSFAAFRFGTHALAGWNDARLYSGVPGARILAYNYNSYGATTVRSVTAEGGRYVPNALAAGYLAAIGATGEPGCCLGPIPETIIAGLREGWTIGESFHLASVYDDWMWTLFADPLMTVPRWFDDEPDPVGSGDGNNDGRIDGLDVALMAGVLSGSVTDPGMRAVFDLTGDGLVNDDDAFLILAPALYNTDDPDILRGGGDLDGSGVVDGKDLRIFVRMLVNGEENESVRAQLRADMNRNGEVDLEDIDLFVVSALRGGLHDDKSDHRSCDHHVVNMRKKPRKF
ncbi:MAG: hypothetical protein H6819_07955 [Phycisphaerales bacterium]|nr:hypothetical protein [Phycisphaerales bacterium]MCB9854291.1 hypothetical protein [Phycisphaerales bacterium]MCB9863492.1 hypothetical protein [Phycisphaerales bacterium]